MNTPTTLNTLPDYGVELTKMLGVIGLFFAVLIVVAWLLTRLARGKTTQRTSKLLHQVDAITLEPGKRVYLIRVGADHYLVGSGPEGLRMLAPGAIPVDGTQPTASTFEAALRQSRPPDAKETPR